MTKPGGTVLAQVFGRPESWAYGFADEEAMLRAVLSAGSAVAAVEQVGRELVVEAILGALAPCRDADGGYRLDNEWHYLVSRA